MQEWHLFILDGPPAVRPVHVRHRLVTGHPDEYNGEWNKDTFLGWASATVARPRGQRRWAMPTFVSSGSDPVHE
jgi:hypothetical protein